MSEKEQAALLLLLRKWLEFESAPSVATVEGCIATLKRRQELIAETKQLLTLPGPESHGQRRS